MKKGLFVLAILLAPVVAFAAVNVTSFTLNGANTVEVTPGASIEVSVSVQATGSGDSNDWRSTSWNIAGDGQAEVCVNTPDHTSSGPSTESFSITAPNTDGSYDLTIKTHRFSGCSFDTDVETRNNAIVVATPPPPPVDVCPNIGGVQETVPGGYELVEGNCVEIVVPPVDACPELDGFQESGPCDPEPPACEVGQHLEGDTCVDDEVIPPPEPELSPLEACIAKGDTWSNDECIHSSGGGMGVSVIPWCDDTENVALALKNGGYCLVREVAPPEEISEDDLITELYKQIIDLLTQKLALISS